MSAQTGRGMIANFVGRELQWVQPRTLQNQYELRDGE